METRLRSMIKAITWRAGGSLLSFVVTWIFTGNAGLATSISLTETVIKIGAFYIHERFWINVEFGKLKKPEYQI